MYNFISLRWRFFWPIGWGRNSLAIVSLAILWLGLTWPASAEPGAAGGTSSQSASALASDATTKSSTSQAQDAPDTYLVHVGAGLVQICERGSLTVKHSIYRRDAEDLQVLPWGNSAILYTNHSFEKWDLRRGIQQWKLNLAERSSEMVLEPHISGHYLVWAEKKVPSGAKPEFSIVATNLENGRILWTMSRPGLCRSLQTAASTLLVQEQSNALEAATQLLTCQLASGRVLSQTQPSSYTFLKLLPGLPERCLTIETTDNLSITGVRPLNNFDAPLWLRSFNFKLSLAPVVSEHWLCLVGSLEGETEQMQVASFALNDGSDGPVAGWVPGRPQALYVADQHAWLFMENGDSGYKLYWLSNEQAVEAAHSSTDTLAETAFSGQACQELDGSLYYAVKHPEKQSPTEQYGLRRVDAKERIALYAWEGPEANCGDFFVLDNLIWAQHSAPHRLTGQGRTILYALDPATGKSRFATQPLMGSLERAGALDKATILAEMSSQRLYAINLKSGQIVKSLNLEPFFNWMKWNNLAGVLLVSGCIGWFITQALRHKDKKFFIRRIAGLSALEEAVGRATEMGKPVLYIPGIADVDDIQTLASLSILDRVSACTAEYDIPIMVPNCCSVVMSMAQDIVRESYVKAGRPDTYQPDYICYLSDEQFGFAAGVSGLMMREKPAAVLYMGSFLAEALMLAETGNAAGAIQIAGTAQASQLPFFVAACDYTLIGEELYAASAYLSNDPLQVGSLKGQDAAKAVIMLVLAAGAILLSFGYTWISEIWLTM